MLASGSLGRTLLDSHSAIAVQMHAVNSCPRRIKASIGQHRLQKDFIPWCRWQPNFLWCSTRWAPENSLLDIESHLYCDRMFPPHLMWWDCTGTLLRFHFCWNSSIAVLKEVSRKKIMGMNNPLDDFGPQKEMQHLARKFLLECPKTKGKSRRIKGSPRLEAEYTGGWIFPSASVTVAVAAPNKPHSLFLKDWWGEWEPLLETPVSFVPHQLLSPQS